MHYNVSSPNLNVIKLCQEDNSAKSTQGDDAGVDTLNGYICQMSISYQSSLVSSLNCA